MIYLCLFCALLVVVSYLCSKEQPFAPAVVVSGIWFITTLLYLLFVGDVGLTTKFTGNMALWVGMFSLGALSMQSLRFSTPFKEMMPSDTARNIYFYIALITLPMLAYDVYYIVSTNTGSNVFITLRDANVRGDETVGRTATAFVGIWLVAYALELLAFSKKNRGRFLFLLCVNLFYAFISMGKNSFLMLFLITVLILYFQSRLKLKTIVLGLAILFVGFIGLQSIRSLAAYKKIDVEEFITLYMLTGMQAFEQTVEPGSAEHWGENSLRIFYAIPYKLGLSTIEPVDPIADFVLIKIKDTDYPTNVYTALFTFYKDFGSAGVAVFALILGLFYGWLFKMAQQKDYFALVLYAILFYYLTIQFMSEQIFSLLSANLQYVLIALFPFLITKYHLFEKKKT